MGEEDITVDLVGGRWGRAAGALDIFSGLFSVSAMAVFARMFAGKVIEAEAANVSPTISPSACSA